MSSETPVGVLAIRNTSTSPIGFNPMTLQYVEHDDAGNVTKSPYITTITHIISTQWIAPGEQIRPQIRLPACTVIADACRHAVALEFQLQIASQAPYVERTAEVTYLRIPDPTATFEEDGLSGDRPMIMVSGIAEGTVYPDDFIIELATGPKAPQPPFSGTPALVGEVASVFARRSVTGVNSTYDPTTTPWNVIVTISQASAQRSAIGAALDDLRRNFGGRIATVSHHFTLNRPQLDPTIAAAGDAARSAAGRIALVLAVGDVSQAYTGGDTGVAIGSRDTAYNSLNGPGPFGRLRVRFDAPPPNPTMLRVRENLAFVASRSVPPLFASRSVFNPPFEYEGNFTGGTLWPGRPVTIEADRPELYVTARTNEREALMFGDDPEYLALAFARRRAREAATLLGVRPDSTSLVVAPEPIPDPHEVFVRAVGLAMTFNAPRAPAPPPPAAAPAPARPIGVYRPPVAAAPPSQDTGPQVPIIPASPETTLTVYGESSARLRADWRRIDIAVKSSIALPDTSALAAALERQPGVEDVAVGGSRNGEPYERGFEIIVRSTDESVVDRAIAIVRRAFPASVHIDVKQTALLSTCGDLERAALAQAIQVAQKKALAGAAAQSVRLRTLIIAAVSPLQVDDDGCTRRSRPDGLSAENETRAAGADVSGQIGIRLTYRTMKG